MKRETPGQAQSARQTSADIPATSVVGCVEVKSECNLREAVQVSAEGYGINSLEPTHATAFAIVSFRFAFAF